jgi:2-polyprenyl-3-methyl-5-hydroxy-6-metoxy-1,4-benzoquinol methylase
MQQQAHRLLEIGCGEGILLDRLRPHGFELTGLEMNEPAARAAQQKKLHVHALSLEQFQLAHPNRRYDAIAFFQVLEHQAHPLNFLRTVYGLVSPHGRIYLSVPNPDRYQLRIKRESWDNPPHHLIRFSKQGITALLERAGFQVHRMIDQPFTEENRTQAAKQLYAQYPLPKRVRQLLKRPLVHVMNRHVAGWSCTGQDLYVQATRDLSIS